MTPLVFLRTRTHVVVRRYEPRTVVNWSPSINLRAIEAVGARYRELTLRVVERNSEHRAREREEMVLRLTSEKTRVEMARGTAPGQAFMRVPPAGDAAPAMLLRQPGKLADAAAAAQAAEHSPAAIRIGDGRLRGSAAPPLDMDRVTDQVMQKLDRRLQAQRERLWRK